MEEIITVAARIMTGDINENNKVLKRRPTAFHGVNTVFLQSLEVCLTSEIGREYFYRNLNQNCCEELTVYLELLRKFKNQM